MSTWKRGFLEIIAEILDSLMSNPLKKTHITFKCNLDSRAVTKYLSIMQNVGLVGKSIENPSLYVITQKGIKYRNQFNSFMSMMEQDVQNISLQDSNSKQLLENLNFNVRN
jgi:predicted transcriptional regulator